MPGGGVPVAAFEALVLVALSVIGAIVASRQPRNIVGWIVCVIPVSLGFLVLGSHVYWSLALANPGDPHAGELVAWISSWVWIPAMVPALTLFPLLFPTGRPPTPRWRPVAWLALAAIPALFVSQAFTPGPFEDYPVANPLGAGESFEGIVKVIGGTGFALMAVAALASVSSLVVRFRRSHGEERQQLKLVTAAAVLFVVIFAFPADQLISEDVGFASLLLGLLIIATAVAIAMLRYRLYDFDVVINRTLVYGALTATLAAVYLGSVLLLQLALNGITADSNLAIAGSTLAVAALFRPARARIQEGVDHRFFRRRYDAARTLESFSARLRDQVDLTALDAELRGVVSETLQPAHVSLWLRGPRDSGA
ncbi:MAG: hypothetical protein WKH68_04950 [Candidatus Limnocylindria bacterium]